MTTRPTTELDAPYSGPGATATDWERTAATLDGAQIYWLSTVRPDGRPHVTPIIAVWAEDRVHFCTGPEEQKARNLAANDAVVVTTGRNEWSGLDVVLEGRARAVTDEAELRELAAGNLSKYGDEWRFDVVDGAFAHEGGRALVFAVAPTKVYAYDRDEPGAATRYRF
jgi:general stress protein 26